MDIVKRLREWPCDQEPFTRNHKHCQCRVANAAADEIEQLRVVLNQSLGIIVEFGNLNGFRNMTDVELGRAVVGMAERIAEVLPKPTP